MKVSKQNTMAVLAFSALLMSPPALINSESTSHNFRTIASITVEEDKPLEVKLPDLEKIEVAEPEAEGIEIKESDLPVPRFRGIDRSEIRAALDTEELGRYKLKQDKIAELVDIKMSHPRYDKIVEVAKDKKLTKKVEFDLKKFQSKRDELQEKITKLKDVKDREQLEALIVDSLLVEDTYEILKDKKQISEDEDEKSQKIITEAKNRIELLLLDLEKPAEKKVASAIVKEKKIEKEEKEEKSEHICDKDEKITLLTDQVKKLIEDQGKITQNMLQMSQMMMMNMMMQQQQLMQQQSLSYQRPQQSAYQYNQPQTAGNWVYYPQGFQPGQPNIFAQQPQQGQPQPMSFHPDNAHQSNWGLQPTMNFNTSSMVTPGTFGSGNGVSYNMSNATPMVGLR